MKKILLLSISFLLIYTLANAQMYANFEDVTPVLGPFSANGDYAPAIMENPFNDDYNPSDSVFGGASVGGTWEGVWFDAGDFIDFSNSFTFTMLVNGEAEGLPMLKIEDNTNGAVFIETNADESYTQVDEWQLMTFTVAGVDAELSEIYNRIVVFMDFGSEEIGNMWYWDNLIGPDGYEGTGLNTVKDRNLVFSNPFSNQLKIYSVAALTDVQIFNAMGQKVLEEHGLNSMSLNLETSQLKNGIYFLQSKDVAGRITKSKMIKK
ncbi:MAG: T9SS type A sorting domain-containing protein [Prolixibacteraceae bacterium]